MFLDPKIGLLFFITHFLASVTVGILFKNYKKSKSTSSIIPQVSIKSNSHEPLKLKNLGKVMGIAIQNSTATLLMILGYMVFFAVLSNILTNTGIENFFNKLITYVLNTLNVSTDLSNGIFCGILEITNGLNKISSFSDISYIETLPIAAFILGFGGFSVHMQVASIISDSDISLKPYLLGKLLQGVFASIYTFILMKFTNFFNWDVVESFSYSNSNFKVVSESSNLIGIIFIIFSVGIVLKIGKKIHFYVKS